jgi:uncharacterized protein with PIN domain
VRVHPDLRFFLPARHRATGEILLAPDGCSTVGHVVESLGVPLPEVGELRAGGVRIGPGRRLEPGDVVEAGPVARPQRLAEERFLLDVHLGALARRMRLVGLDTAYHRDAGDPELVDEAVAQRRVLLTRDRGLLRRRALPAGAYVRGDRADEQLADVVQRFAPTLAPWTRCPACNGPLRPAALDEVADRLEPGTRRTYTRFSHCPGCGRVYWQGAHARRLTAVVDRALREAVGNYQQ